jgi:hypothetical protein
MSATARPTRGLLSQQAWAAIARMYAARDGGLVLYFSTVWRSVASWEIAPKWSTVVRLRNRKVPYVEEVKIDGETCVRLTSPGALTTKRTLTAIAPRIPKSRFPGPARLRRSTARTPCSSMPISSTDASSSRSPMPRSRPAAAATPPSQCDSMARLKVTGSPPRAGTGVEGTGLSAPAADTAGHPIRARP